MQHSSYEWQAIPPDADLLSDWAQLYDACATTPLLHPDFLAAALEVFGDETVRLLACRRDGELIAAAATHTIDRFRQETFQPSQAPIGFWLQRREVDTEPLLPSLVRALPGLTASLAITQQDPDLLPRPPLSQRLHTSDYIDTARITIGCEWESYWRERGSNLRHNIKRSRSKLANANRSIELRVVQDASSMAEAVDTYAQIESKSWKAEEGTAVSPGNRQALFYTALLTRFAQRGRARCYQLLIDGKVATTDLCILGRDEIVILKTTYDEDFKPYSPASLMREMAFSQLFTEGWCRRIEFYGRVMQWHLHWTDEVRRMYHISYFRHGLIQKAWQAAKQVGA